LKIVDKTILIISQDDWGTMMISKHHYAIELAKKGNRVYYNNGPDQRKILKKGEIRIKESGIENLYLVHHRFIFPYIIKFHNRPLFNFFVKRHIARIIRAIGVKPDMVWSFDLSDTIPLRYFPKDCLKLYMPVDEPVNQTAIDSAKGADVIVSVTNEILEKYKRYQVNRHFINHGVSDIFLDKNIPLKEGSEIRVGMSGNFLRPDIDRKTILEIIQQNPTVVFELWGGISVKDTNLANESNEDNSTLEFIQSLESSPNVICHGPVSTAELAKGLNRMDAFLICYDIKKDQSKGTNYHKIMEYLSTGKVIISNNVTTYENTEGLIEMCKSRISNDELPALVKKILLDIEFYNSFQKQMQRRNFAVAHSYKKQIEKIGNFFLDS